MISPLAEALPNASSHFGGPGEGENGEWWFAEAAVPLSNAMTDKRGDPVPTTPLLPQGFFPEVLGSKKGHRASAAASGFSKRLGLSFTFRKMLMRN